MKTRTKFSVADIIVNYVLLTPLVILYWFGTYSILDLVVFDNIESRTTAAILVFTSGLAVEFTVTYWQDDLASVALSYRSSRSSLLAYTRLYNYVLAFANISHYRGIQELYDLYVADGPGDLRTALQAASTAILVLWSLRAGRNLTAIPFCVSVDTDSDTSSWFGASTLYQFDKRSSTGYLFDTFITAGVVWTLGPLHWITLGYCFDFTIFPNNALDAMITSCVVGYGIVGLCTALQHKVKALSRQLERDNRFLVKTLLEDLYIYIATAAVILSWKGVGMAVDMLAKQFPIVHGDTDMTGVYANIVSFLLLSACYTSGCLVGKGAERDGSLTDGSGVEFSTDYFAHFFRDFIEEQERKQL